ncbi:unnamed protein product, partial [Allacma fusca]
SIKLNKGVFGADCNNGVQAVNWGQPAHQGIRCMFNTPHSPHFGSIWEAAVKSAKYNLRRVTDGTTLTRSQYHVLLAQIELVLNSRPLCPLSSDHSDLHSGSPSHRKTHHFLSGARSAAFAGRSAISLLTERGEKCHHWILCPIEEKQSTTTEIEIGPYQCIARLARKDFPWAVYTALFVFPQSAKFDRIRSFPAGSIFEKSKRGWSTSQTFLVWLKHFRTHAAAERGTKVLLLLDNHSSHVCYDAVMYAAKNNIEMLTIPPHCTHKLQPLDISFFGPLKSKYGAALTEWLAANQGRIALNEDLTEIIKTPFEMSCTAAIAINGFRKTGLWLNTADGPDRFVFSEAEFSPGALHSGADDLVRVVTVRTKAGEFKRSIVKLSVLPVDI